MKCLPGPSMHKEAPTVEFKTANLSVRFYQRDASRVVVVFASAGAKRVGGHAEEFAGTLSKLGISSVFVTDQHVRWYNYDETEDVLRKVAEMVADFEHVGVMGESLGGSGALLFTRFARNISRVLAITPQYSVAKPFIRFDDRYLSASNKIARYRYGTFADSPIKDRCLIVYGNTSWRDSIHASMFRAADFPIAIVDGAPHELSRFLKSDTAVNNLWRLVQTFCDFGEKFDIEAVHHIETINWSSKHLKDTHSFSAAIDEEIEFNRCQIEPMPLPAVAAPLVSAGKRATQSSISAASVGRTVEDDAAGAVNGSISKKYNFHTASEDSPWWKLDLGDEYRIHEVRLFNRLEHVKIAARALRFDILVSDDDVEWTVAFSKDDDVYFGGADGRPFVFAPVQEIRARFIKVRLKGYGCLHLNQVQIYGEVYSDIIMSKAV